MWVATSIISHSISNFTISTHTTHVGGDFNFLFICQLQTYFNSHHPCGWRLPVPPPPKPREPISTHTTHVGGDAARVGNIGSCHPFQLTPPMWVATVSIKSLEPPEFEFQLTPPMWVATGFRGKQFLCGTISTHTTHVGGDKG